MKISLWLATLVAVVTLALLPNRQQTSAQQPGGQAPTVATVDIAYIFKNHLGFKAQIEQMKRDAEAAEDTLKKEQALLKQMVEKLKEFKPGTPDFKKLEEDITQRQANAQVSVSLQKKEFMERETKIHSTIYREIEDAVKYYADRTGIQLVLQFNGDPLDVNNRQSVAMNLNKLVVYQRGIDITPIILESLNRSRGAATGAPGVPPSAMKTGVQRPQSFK